MRRSRSSSSYVDRARRYATMISITLSRLILKLSYLICRHFDHSFQIKPRLATFTSLQNQVGDADPLIELASLVKRSAYVDAVNLSSSLINTRLKDSDPFYTTPEVFTIWTLRFEAIMRCLETNNDSFYQLAEAEGLPFFN